MNTIDFFISKLVPIALIGFLPIVLAWLSFRHRQHETDKRSEIIMAVIEKNPEVDVQEFLNKLNPPKKSFKEQLMTKMHYEVLLGTICTIGGITTILGSIVMIIVPGFNDAIIPIGAVFGVAPLAVGSGLLVAYNNAKKTLENLKDND